MLERTLRIPNALGLHARAAAQLVRLSSQYKCSVTVRREDSGVTADARSILGLLHLAAGCGVLVAIIANGDDEAAAINAIQELFIRGFGEL